MANTLTAIVPKVLARGLLALREQARMPRLVNGDYSSEAAKKGTTIDVPVPVAQTVSDVTPSNTPPAPADNTPTTVQIPLDQWKKTNFHLTDKEMKEIDAQDNYLPGQASESIRAIANTVNQYLLGKYTGVYGYTGTAGTTPFASTVAGATNLRKVLHSQLCPRDLRRGVLDFDAEANALALSPFSDAEKVGSDIVKIEGEIGRKFGIDWVSDDHVPTHTTGTLSDGTSMKCLVNNASVAIGDTSVPADETTLTGTVVVGDIFTVAGDTQTYVIDTAATASSNAITLSFTPAAKVAWADDAQITFKDDHVVNLGFHRDAFAFANRPLSDPLASEMSEILSMTDPVTGLSLRLEVSRQYKQTVWEFDLLYGGALIRPELAARLAG